MDTVEKTMPAELKHKWKAPIAVTLILAAILCYALYLRINTFWLSHWKGDQNNYIVLAMKLDYGGLEAYTLREVLVGSQVLSTNPRIEFFIVKPAPRGDEGDLIRVLREVGQDYFDQPLHVRAPLFSYILMWSHRLLVSGDKLYRVCSSHLGAQVKHIKPKVILLLQFWVCLVPLLMNLAVIGMTFWLGVAYFNPRVGLIAAFIMATNPVSLLLAHLILVEDLATIFIILAFMLYARYFGKNKGGVFLAGICVGFSILGKQTSGVILGGLWVYSFLMRKPANPQPKNLLKAFFSTDYLICLGGALLIAGPWFYKVWRIYGSPFYVGDPAILNRASLEDVTGWFRALRRRPPPIIFFSLGIVKICPLFIFAFFSIKKLIGETRRIWSKSDNIKPQLLFFWVWILTFYFLHAQPWRILTVGQNQEHRYFYTAYPAIAVVSAYVIDRFRGMISKVSSIKWLPDAVILCLLIWNAWVCIPIGMGHVFENNLLL